MNRIPLGVKLACTVLASITIISLVRIAIFSYSQPEINSLILFPIGFKLAFLSLLLGLLNGSDTIRKILCVVLLLGAGLQIITLYVGPVFSLSDAEIANHLITTTISALVDLMVGFYLMSESVKRRYKKTYWWLRLTISSAGQPNRACFCAALRAYSHKINPGLVAG